jgi:hypothetical protein
MPTNDPVEDVTPYPNTQKRYIDLTQLSPEVEKIIRDANLDLDIRKIAEQREKLRNSDGFSSSTNKIQTSSK